MTSKRSRKAFEEDLQRQESPFVVFGTPLPPLDDDARDDGSYLPVWKQEVTDDRGRKRLHGAFTGGYSAGYFNTVGSKEGWTPSTFVSSRSNRAKDNKDLAQSKPEDFMDEEDIREQEESRQISTSNEFAGFGTENDTLRQSTVMDLFKPSEESVGARLLNKMGWKYGQGIGPKVRRLVEGDDENAEAHLFAPDDVPMVSFSKKHDSKGLGYQAQAGALISHTKSTPAKILPTQQSDDEENNGNDRPGLSFMARKQNASKKARSGFGVGIMNDTGSDDEDPYSIGPKISYNKTLGSDKKSKKKVTSTFGAANPLLKSKPLFVPKKLSSLQNALRKCHDGRLPLTGFVLSDELDSFSSMSLNEEKYKPPEVPPDWNPAKLMGKDSSVSVMSHQSPAYQSISDTAKQSTHTSASRAALLGEQKLPGKSIFDFLTPEAREKLVKATGKTNLPPALSEHLPGSHNTSSPTDNHSTIDIPYLDPVTAKAALSRAETGGFIPYAEDLDKRKRYKHFLDLSVGLLPEGTLPMKPSDTIRTNDWLIELNEFVRAAEVFRPMTGAIASRFTSSTTSTLNPDINNPNASDNGTENLIRKPVSKPEDPAEVAARLGMFGVMTRSLTSFQPTRLVCKRFGVDMPIYMPQETGQKFTPSKSDIEMLSALQSTAQNQGMGEAPSTSATYTTSGPISHNTEGANVLAGTTSVHGTAPLSSEKAISGNYPTKAVIDPDTNEALEQERPGEAVFRAIFGDSDTDEE